jgi:ParB family chromosome partitioning protein
MVEKTKGGGPMEPTEERRVLRLPVAEIRPNPRQPRRFFDERGLRELAASIRRHGIIQPLTVRRIPQGWELVAGERRLRAAKLAGLETVPCIEAAADDRESALLALVENLQRRDLHYFEEAAAIADYLRQSGVTQEEAASLLGRSPSAVANKLRLLRLSPACREILVRNRLSERHARCLLRLEDEQERLAAARYMAQKELNVAQAEQYIERRLAALQSVPPAGRRTFILKDVRLFLNSLDRGLRLIREAGVDAQSGREETEDAIVLTIRIPKQRRPKT